jgi:hypothetical protein
MTNERYIEKDEKGRGRSLFEVLSLDLPEVIQESHVRIANVPEWDSNQSPPEFRSRELPLRQSLRLDCEEMYQYFIIDHKIIILCEKNIIEKFPRLTTLYISLKEIGCEQER